MKEYGVEKTGKVELKLDYEHRSYVHRVTVSTVAESKNEETETLYVKMRPYSKHTTARLFPAI